jgi:hypothetical protein
LKPTEITMSAGAESGLSIAGCLGEISGRLVDAAAVAKTAVTCAEAGSERQAVRIVLDVEEMIHETNTLLNGVTLMSRMERAMAGGIEVPPD